jgi:hypothetical protein
VVLPLGFKYLEKGKMGVLDVVVNGLTSFFSILIPIIIFGMILFEMFCTTNYIERFVNFLNKTWRIK